MSVPDAIPPTAPGRRLPTGTVTFVFSDIEGSTERWEHNRAEMQEALRRHDAVMRSAISEHGGYVFKTIGDAFCSVFERAENAITAILAVQRALAAEDFTAVDGVRVRAALHTGTSDERDGDYFGPAVNRVARLLAIGHGGQVLVSGVTADLVQGLLPPQASLRDLGEHRLKDLARPEQVYQLHAPGLATEFPPLRSLEALPNNLPHMLTSFVGRERELGEIAALIDKHQLVTMVGSGGVGKTRASLQVAANLLDGSGDGVWFIELAPLASGEYIPAAVAQAMGFTLPAGHDPLDALVRALKSKRALLVFDNCEHLVEAAAQTIAAIIRGCPTVKVLASSRQGLGIAGEAAYRMPSLGLPNAADSATFNAVETARYAAVTLFVERASAADYTFTMTEENAPIIVEICRRLDGIPLAIELAAARVKILSPKQLRERLNERFRVLTGGSRDVLPRQQTLRALIDWSHDLLVERERTLFRRLGIFVNGFALEGAAAVGGSADFDELDVFDVLASLVDKSLVLAETAGDSLRYRLLESTRVYAREKLELAGEREACAELHLRYLHRLFAEAGEHRARTGRTSGVTDLLRTELDDVRAALDYSVTGAHPELGADILTTCSPDWIGLGLDAEGKARLEAHALALPESEAALISAMWAWFAHIANNSGWAAQAHDAGVKAVAFARASEDPQALAFALGRHSMILFRLGKLDEAEVALAEAAAVPDQSRFLSLNILTAKSGISLVRGDLDAAARDLQQLYDHHRAVGNALAGRSAAGNLAEVEHARGNTLQALELLRGVMPPVEGQLNRSGVLNARANLAGYLLAIDDIEGAVASARDAIHVVIGIEPASPIAAITAEHLALAAALRGDLERAARLEGYADANLHVNAFVREYTERVTQDRLMALLEQGLAPDDLARFLAEGAALAPEAALAYALEEQNSSV